IPNNKGRIGTEELVAGPIVAPGSYQAQLVVRDQTYSQPIEILRDPRISATQSDLDRQFALAMQINKKLSETHDAIIRIRKLRDQADGWAERSSNQAVKDGAKALSKTLTTVESELIQVK